MSVSEFQIGVGIVLAGTIASFVTAPLPLGILLIVAGVGWLLRDTTDALAEATPTDALAEATPFDRRSEAEDPEPEVAGVDGDRGRDLDVQSAQDRSQQILETVRRHDGRVRQKQIVEEVDLSEASVSRYITALESSGDVSKLRIGRENLVFLDEENPAMADSPNLEQPA